jgi:hypothetical protein
MVMVPVLFAQNISVTPESLRYDSIVKFDASGKRIEKGIYNYTAQGLQIVTEYYVYTNGIPELRKKTKLLNDNGNEVTTNDSTLNNGSWVSGQITYKLDSHGNLTEQTIKSNQTSIVLSNTIYYGINDRIDSFYVDISYYGTVEKHIYTYNANGLPTVLETYSFHYNSLTVTEYNYIINTDNKLEGRLSGIFTTTNGIFDISQNRKEVLFYDALERPEKNELYTWDTLTNDYKEQYDSYTIRYYKTNTAIPRYLQSDILVTVSINNGSLTINSPVSETIEIYSTVGLQLYKDKKGSGQTTVALPSFSQGVYIVRGSSGWTKKVWIQ